jgi:hypothetical protein
MSRRHVSADEPGLTWEYGWDPTRGTFYARLRADEGHGRELANFGSRVGEVRSVDALMYLMGVRLPADRISALEHDRLMDSEEVEEISGHSGPRRLAVASDRGH